MNNQTVDELNNRKLNECYFSIMFIPIKIYLKRGENNTNLKQLYVFYGCTLQGAPLQFFGNGVHLRKPA